MDATRFTPGFSCLHKFVVRCNQMMLRGSTFLFFQSSLTLKRLGLGPRLSSHLGSSQSSQAYLEKYLLVAQFSWSQFKNIQGCQILKKICSRRWGSAHARPSARPLQRTCLQSHLQTSPPTPQKSYSKFWS